MRHETREEPNGGMDVRVVLILSIVAQLSAAALSIRLIRITSHRIAWGLIASAVSLMAVRRIVTLTYLFTDASAPATSISAEWIALAISVGLAVGLALIGPMFERFVLTTQTARESERTVRALMSISPAGLFRTDGEGAFVDFGMPWLEITGLPAEGIRGNGWLDAVHPDDWERVRSAWAEGVRTADTFGMEFRLQRPDGVTTWVLAQAVREQGSGDRHSGLVGAITDITQRKEAEAELRAAKDDFERMLGVSPAVLYRCGPAPVYATEFISANVCRQLGYAPEAFLADPHFWIDRVHPDDRSRVKGLLESIDDMTPRRYEYRFRRHDGTYVWLHDQFQPTIEEGRLTGLVGSWFDVSAQRAATEALRRFEELAEATTDFVGMAGRDGRIMYVNKGGRAMVGLGENEPLDGLKVADLHHHHVTTAIVDPAHDHAARFGSWQGESILLTRDGKEIPTLQVISAHRSASGDVEYFSTVMRDITTLKETERQLRQSHENLERRVAERTKELTEVNARMLGEIAERQRVEYALRQNEQRLNQILGTVPLALYTTPYDSTDADWVSEQFERVSGYAPELAVSEPDFWAKRVHPDDGALVQESRRRVREQGGVTVEYRWRCADGVYRWFRDQMTMVFNTYGAPQKVVGTWLDITPQKKAEAELRQSQEQMSAILHNSPAVIYLKDAEGRYIFINEKYLSIFHWAEEDILDRTDDELFDAERAAAFRANDQAVLRRRAPTEFEEIAVVDGVPRTFLSLKFPLYDERGQPRAVCGISTDITDRKEAEDALAAKSTELANLAQELKTVLDHTGDFVYKHNANGVFEYCSPSVEQITGYTFEEWPKHYTANLTDAPINEQVIHYTEQTLTTGQRSPTYLVEIFHKQGHRVTLEVNERALWARGRVVGIIGVARDVTARIRADAELKRAKEAAEAASQAKSVFLANLSHEIRTPIMAMMGAAELSADQHLRQEQLESYRDTVLRNSRHLLALINDLLDVARLEAGKIDMFRRPCALVDLLANVRAATASLPDAARVETRYLVNSPVPRQIETDPTRLAQALINLVSNAIKFTEEGVVTVGVAADPDRPEPRLTFSVSDTGRGIAEADRERVFENFAQAGTHAKEAVGGIGLGLPLARAIAEQLGGDLTVESQEGVGSTFRLRVAVGDVAGDRWMQPSEFDLDEPAMTAPAPEPEALEMSILVAEDFPDTRELIEHSLRRAGARVVVVDDGAKAVAAARASEFDLILLDVRMPVLSGRDAVLQMRRNGCRSPVIALTASTTADGIGRLIASGFDDVWSKPITLADLMARVAQYRPVAATAGGAPGPSSDVRSREIDAKLASIREGFVSSLGEKVEMLRGAASRSDRTLLRERLHQLIGSAGVYGFLEISAEAARLLDLAKRGGLDEKPGALDGLAELAEQAAREQ